MKKTTLIGTFLVIVSGIAWAVWSKELASFSDQIFFERTIRISKTRYINQKELENWLPAGHTTLWWYMNPAEIEVRAMQHPLVGSAEVEPCSGAFEWGCFDFNLTERHPRMRVLVQKREWLADSDGVLLAPVPRGDEEGAFDDLPFIYGLVGESLSPDEAQARLRFLSRSLLELQAETGRYIRSVQFLPRGELRVYFEGVDFPVRFGSPVIPQPGGIQPVSLMKQVDRMEHVLAKLPSTRIVSELDLGFSTLAIVRKESG